MSNPASAWEGRVAFVTGAATGIGLGVAQAFADAGMRLALSYRNEDDRRLAAQWFAAKGYEEPLFLKLDVTDRARFAEVAEEAVRHFGEIHVLVNNAGVSVFGPTDEASYDDYDWIMGVNFGGVVNGLVSFLPKIKAAGGRRHVVNVASMAAFLPGPQAGIYTASKFAVRGLTESLRYNLAAHGIGCSLCCPALTRTNAWTSALKRPEGFGTSGFPEVAKSQLEQFGTAFEEGMDPLRGRDQDPRRNDRAKGPDPDPSRARAGLRGDPRGGDGRAADRGGASRAAQDRAAQARRNEGGRGRAGDPARRSHLSGSLKNGPNQPLDAAGRDAIFAAGVDKFGRHWMCDDLTLEADDAALAKRGLSRREFAAISAATMTTLAAGSAALAQPAPPTTGSSAPQPTTETAVTITTPDGKMDGFFVYPTAGKHPAIIMWPDIAGLRDAYKAMARSLAAQGYAVLAVNQYYRSSPAPVLNTIADFFKPENREKLGPMMQAITPPGIASDAKALVAWLDTQAPVDTAKKIGVEGYCMTGGYGARCANAVPARIGAACSFHGAGLVTPTPDSPDKLLKGTKTLYLFCVARNDNKARPGERDQLRLAAEDAQVGARIELFAADHGWCTLDAPAYQKEEADRARTLSLWNYSKMG